MLDLKAIRKAPEDALAALARRGDGSQDTLREALILDTERRQILPQVEDLRAQQNKVGEQIAAAKSAGENADQALAEMRVVASEAKQLKDKLDAVEAQLGEVQASIPNLPADAAPDEDTTLREVGDFDPADATPDHLEIAGSLIDMEAGARTSGARFAYLKGDMVRLELALVQYTLDKLSAQGFVPVIPPVLVRERALFGTGFLPDTEQQIYKLADDDLYLVGTSEVALASLHDDEMLDPDQLPLRYAGYSPCFRREAGAAGKDTRGIFRVHQFDKVEMFVFCPPDAAADEHERILAIQESIMSELGIPYRVVDIAVNDLGASASRKFDVEGWLPSQQRYRELTSCSNTTDFQTRRLNIRYKGGGQPSITFPHTLNGTACALGRTMIAILENNFHDQVVPVPSVLTHFGAPQQLGNT